MFHFKTKLLFIQYAMFIQKINYFVMHNTFEYFGDKCNDRHWSVIIFLHTVTAFIYRNNTNNFYFW